VPATTAALQLRARLASCDICPHRCGVNRLAGETGFCGIGADPVIASAAPHFGEEPPLVGSGGSGTIFFTGCNLKCVFCQNADISHHREGSPVSVEDLARMMLRLEAVGCHNINWVTPTHQIHAIIEALDIARKHGLNIPTVYNCGGYEAKDTLKLIQGCVDIYMPDAKYASPETAEEYSHAETYPQVMRDALREMHRQVGDLQIRNGLAASGLLVRHLVMPGLTDESIAILDFIAREISPDTFVNVMDQYRPAYRAHEYPNLARRITPGEYRKVVRHARQLGLRLCE